jgi:hypothetical protein
MTYLLFENKPLHKMNKVPRNVCSDTLRRKEISFMFFIQFEMVPPANNPITSKDSDNVESKV